MEYLLHIVILACLFSILALSLDLVIGHAGLLSVAHAAFFAVGAYTAALLSAYWTSELWISIPAGALLAGGLSLMVTVPAARLIDDHFMIATFALQVVFYSFLKNAHGITNGAIGIAGIPAASLFGISIESRIAVATLSGAALVVSFILIWRITHSPFGRTLHAVREDEVLARSFGKNVSHLKVTVYAMSAALAAVPGCIFAHYMSFVEPTSFSIMESVLIISMVVIGGSGSIGGPILGAATLVLLPELMRFVGFPGTVAANLRQVLYGGTLVLMMMGRPQGLVGQYRFGRG